MKGEWDDAVKFLLFSFLVVEFPLPTKFFTLRHQQELIMFTLWVAHYHLNTSQGKHVSTSRKGICFKFYPGWKEL